MKGLGKEEWDFTNLPNNELQICFDYELTREATIQDIERQQSLSALEVSNVSWLEDVVNDLREDAIKAAQINDFDGWIDHWVHFFIAKDYIIPVIYREWPKGPYLTIDANERKRRAERLKRSKESDEDCALFLTELRLGETHITLSIPDWLTHKKLRDLFGGLLRARFPEQGRHGQRKRPSLYQQGRKASFENIRDDLAALSVWRLANRGDMSRRDIINVLKRKDLRKPRYRSEKALDKPMARARERISSCQFWPGVLDTFRTQKLPLVLSDPHHALDRIKEQTEKEFSELSSLLEIE